MNRAKGGIQRILGILGRLYEPGGLGFSENDQRICRTTKILTMSCSPKFGPPNKV